MTPTPASSTVAIENIDFLAHLWAENHSEIITGLFLLASVVLTWWLNRHSEASKSEAGHLSSKGILSRRETKAAAKAQEVAVRAAEHAEMDSVYDQFIETCIHAARCGQTHPMRHEVLKDLANARFSSTTQSHLIRLNAFDIIASCHDYTNIGFDRRQATLAVSMRLDAELALSMLQDLGDPKASMDARALWAIYGIPAAFPGGNRDLALSGDVDAYLDILQIRLPPIIPREAPTVPTFLQQLLHRDR